MSPRYNFFSIYAVEDHGGGGCCADGGGGGCIVVMVVVVVVAFTFHYDRAHCCRVATVHFVHVRVLRYYFTVTTPRACV